MLFHSSQLFLHTSFVFYTAGWIDYPYPAGDYIICIYRILKVCKVKGLFIFSLSLKLLLFLTICGPRMILLQLRLTMAKLLYIFFCMDFFFSVNLCQLNIPTLNWFYIILKCHLTVNTLFRLYYVSKMNNTVWFCPSLLTFLVISSWNLW